jgi:uncharacterized damage-inducible protein DinB
MTAGVPLMQRQMRHDVWATETLIAYCRRLSPEQLELTVPGTYGTVRRTLAHIISADENYLVRLLGKLLHDPPLRPADDATLDQLAAHLAHVKAGVEELFAGAEPEPDRMIPDTPLRRPDAARIEMLAWVPATQFVHHGSDHRAQIGTILGAHGLEPPDLQVWPYSTALGATRQVP